jgi:PBP1b-binding outer membrane lipoprotein LpoB
MTKNVLLVAGAAVAALSLAACSKPADTTNTADASSNAMASSATNDVTNTAANTADNSMAATNPGQ